MFQYFDLEDARNPEENVLSDYHILSSFLNISDAVNAYMGQTLCHISLRRSWLPRLERQCLLSLRNVDVTMYVSLSLYIYTYKICKICEINVHMALYLSLSIHNYKIQRILEVLCSGLQGTKVIFVMFAVCLVQTWRQTSSHFSSVALICAFRTCFSQKQKLPIVQMAMDQYL